MARERVINTLAVVQIFEPEQGTPHQDNALSHPSDHPHRYRITHRYIDWIDRDRQEFGIWSQNLMTVHTFSGESEHCLDFEDGKEAWLCQVCPRGTPISPDKFTLA